MPEIHTCVKNSQFCLDLTYHVYFSGWQWDPKDRPTFHDILISLENMFDKTNVNEGRECLRFCYHHACCYKVPK